jgi:hypothetical protein
MTLQLRTADRNAILDELIAQWGADLVLKIRTGAAPANVATADSGTVLATLSGLDFAAASGGAISMTGAWEDAAADATGTAAHFRIYQTDGTTCVAQGTVGAGSGDLQLVTTSLVAGQPVEITTFTLTAPGA